MKPESLRQILIVLQVFINKSLKWFLPLIDISLYAESDGQWNFTTQGDYVAIVLSDCGNPRGLKEAASALVDEVCNSSFWANAPLTFPHSLSSAGKERFQQLLATFRQYITMRLVLPPPISSLNNDDYITAATRIMALLCT